MPAKLSKERRTHVTLTRTSEVLNVRKVGRKWLTTRNALLRWIESSSENNTLAKAIERGDRHVITTALKSGKAQIKKR